MHHPLTRRMALQAGAISLLGLSTGPLAALADTRKRSAKSCIFIFLSGGLAQHDSFDLKPGAPAEIRGEFKPIATRTPGIQICEHLPMLAARSERWSLVRSMTHKTNDHSLGHLYMLTGRGETPVGFNPSKPQPGDWPSIASVATGTLAARHNLPPAVVLPDRIVHNSGRVIPGQFGGQMGPGRDPWFLEASPFDPKSYGAYPTHSFDHQERAGYGGGRIFSLPSLTLPESVDGRRFEDRLSLLKRIDDKRRSLEAERFTGFHAGAVSMLTSSRVRSAFDVTRADSKTLDRYGKNSFGYSLLMARRLVEAGVALVQVNLGNNESWDTHGNAFPHLKDKLFPPTDRALSALLDDLHDTGLLDSTLVIMAGEFGRTPRIFGLPKFYKLPGRDHWGAVQSVFLAGGGLKGGRVVGSSDRNGAYPATLPQTPENFGATIYQALGLPRTAEWHDATGRPNAVYHGEVFPGLS